MSSRFALARHMHVVSSSKTSMESFLFSFPRAPYPVVLIIHYRFCIYHDQTCRATYWGTPYRSPRPAMLYIITKEEVAVMWYDGQGDRMGIATSANTVCIHHRAENSVPHPSFRSFGHFRSGLCATNAPLPHHKMTWPVCLVLIPCPGFCVSMRRQGGTIRMTNARGGRAVHSPPLPQQKQKKNHGTVHKLGKICSLRVM